MANTTSSEVPGTIQATVSELVQEKLRTQSKFLGTIRDVSGDVGPGEDRVSYPKLVSELTPATKAEGTGLTTQAINFAVDTLIMDQHKALYALLEDRVVLQSKVGLQVELADAMAYALVNQVDAHIYAALVAGVSAAAPDHIILKDGPGTSLSQDNILEAEALLDEANAPEDGRILAISPRDQKAMLAISDFVRADSYGSPEGLINGRIGRVYGFDVIKSNQVDVTGGVLAYHPNSMVYARQMAMSFESDRNLAEVGTEYLMNHLYGSKVLYDGKTIVRINDTGIA